MSAFSTAFRVISFIFVIISLSNYYVQSSAFQDPHHVGNRSVNVHLFEWTWNDIANECENFLAPYGYGSIQVSPVSENIVMNEPFRPWWERYQPISYKLTTRSGNENEFKSMVNRCNKVGVRIYVDVVFNHMTGILGSIIGTDGSTADAGQRDYPAIPYGPENFHPSCTINDYNNATEVRVCQLAGLPDLDQGNEDTRQKIIKFLNKLLELGVAGFRIDAAKHMWPSDLDVIYNSLDNLNTDVFPPNSKPYIYQEVNIGYPDPIQETDYTHIAPAIEFMYTHAISKAFQKHTLLKDLKSWGQDWGFLPSEDVLVFVCNHDNQRSGDGDILTYKTPQKYVMAHAFMLAHPYGVPQVMSSFNFTTFDDGSPAHENGSTISPIFDSSGQCTNGWVCEHRWPAIRNMVQFRNNVANEPLQLWWDNGSNQIAFCRGNSGFVAFNNDEHPLNMRLHTCLPSGTYCDVISGENNNGQCTGASIEVDENGDAHINLEPDTVLAIYFGAKL